MLAGNDSAAESDTSSLLDYDDSADLMHLVVTDPGDACRQ